MAFAIAVPIGCSTLRLQPEELPAEPIAFLHWADRAGQKRSEIFASAAEVPPLPVDEEDPERFEELRVRAHLRADERLALRAKLSKHPGRVMLIWPRTGEMEPIEAAPLDAMPLAWSKDRKRLLLASSHRGGKAQLFEYHLERRDLSPVTGGALEHARGAYTLSGAVLSHQIERLSPRGVSANTVHAVQPGGLLGPVLAQGVPPGSFASVDAEKLLVYEQVRLRKRSHAPSTLESWIASQPMTGSGEERLLAKGREPAVTPDGAWIVFASPTAAGYRLRRMRPDGTSKVPIGPGGTEERMPTVSPDGQFVAFSNSAHGRRRLTVRRFDGKDERVLLTSGWSEYPVW